MAELHWFPFFTKDWLASDARALMTHEQRGVYLDLLARAWGDGAAEPSLPSSDAALATISELGARWKKVGVEIRAQFVERDGKLYNEKLSDVWKSQQEKHGKAVEKAKLAVAAREAKRKKGRGSSRSNRGDHLQDDPRDGHGSDQSDSEVGVEPYRVLPPTASGDALALEGARAAGAIPGEAPASVAEVEQLRRRWQRKLRASVIAWRDEHPDEWEKLIIAERRLQGPPSYGVEPKPDGEMREQMMFEAVADRLRISQQWPDEDTWVERQLAPSAIDDDDEALSASVAA